MFQPDIPSYTDEVSIENTWQCKLKNGEKQDWNLRDIIHVHSTYFDFNE